MSAGRSVRTLRAAMFAVVCVLFAVQGHVMTSGVAVPGWALAAGAVAAGGVAWGPAARERGLFVVGNLAVATQVVLHAVFSLTQAVLRPESASLPQRWVRYLLCTPPGSGTHRGGAATTAHSMNHGMAGMSSMDDASAPTAHPGHLMDGMPPTGISPPTWPPPCCAACGSPTVSAPPSVSCGFSPGGSSLPCGCRSGCPRRRTARASAPRGAVRCTRCGNFSSYTPSLLGVRPPPDSVRGYAHLASLRPLSSDDSRSQQSPEPPNSALRPGSRIPRRTQVFTPALHRPPCPYDESTTSWALAARGGEEAARAGGRPVGTVRSRLARARSSLIESPCKAEGHRPPAAVTA